MLRTPWAGWSDITIGDWTDRCSYIDNVPIMLLRTVCETLKGFQPQAVEFDAEGYNYIIVFDKYETHIITAKDDFIYTTVEINIDKLAQELIEDIYRDLDFWVEWMGAFNYTDKNEIKECLLSYCREIENVL